MACPNSQPWVVELKVEFPNSQAWALFHHLPHCLGSQEAKKFRLNPWGNCCIAGPQATLEGPSWVPFLLTHPYSSPVRRSVLGSSGGGGRPPRGRQGRATDTQFFQFMSTNFNETGRMQDTTGDARILKTGSSFLRKATTQESGITI